MICDGIRAPAQAVSWLDAEVALALPENAENLSRWKGSTMTATPDWRPIENAPKDGTPVLVYAPQGCTQWTMYTPLWICRWDTGRHEGGAWTEAGGELWTTCEPTHWMPLPQPPESSGQNLADAHSKNPPGAEHG